MPSKAFGSASLLPQCCFVPDKALKIAFWRWDSLPMWISTPSEPALPRRRKPQSTRLSKKRIEIGNRATRLARQIRCNPREPMPAGLPFHLNDNLALVDWTGRIIRDDNKGAIGESLPPILDSHEDFSCRAWQRLI